MTIVKTDSGKYIAWKLYVDEGRQVWKPIEVENEAQAQEIQTAVDRHWLTKDAVAYTLYIR